MKDSDELEVADAGNWRSHARIPGYNGGLQQPIF